MEKPFPFVKLDVPSTDEMTRATEIEHEVVAISIVNDEHMMFLKLLCRNGENTVVWLDAFMADHLFRHLELILGGEKSRPLPAVRTKFIASEVGSLGTVPRSLG